MYDDDLEIPMLIVAGIMAFGSLFVAFNLPFVMSVLREGHAPEPAPVTATTPETSAPAPAVTGTVTGTVTGKVKGTITGTITGTVTDTATTVEPQEN